MPPRNLPPACAVGHTSRASPSVARSAHPHLVRVADVLRHLRFVRGVVDHHVGHVCVVVVRRVQRPRRRRGRVDAVEAIAAALLVLELVGGTAALTSVQDGSARTRGGPCNGDHRRPPKVVQPRCTAEESHGDGPCRPGEGASRGSSREVRRAANIVTSFLFDQVSLAFFEQKTGFLHPFQCLKPTKFGHRVFRVLRRDVVLSWHTNIY